MWLYIMPNSRCHSSLMENQLSAQLGNAGSASTLVLRIMQITHLGDMCHHLQAVVACAIIFMFANAWICNVHNMQAACPIALCRWIWVLGMLPKVWASKIPHSAPFLLVQHRLPALESLECDVPATVGNVGAPEVSDLEHQQHVEHI